MVRGYSTGALLKMGTQLARSLKQRQRKKKEKQMSRKGQFKKGGGRVGGAARRSRSTSLARSSSRVVTRTRTVRVPVYRRAKMGGAARAHGGGKLIPGAFRLKSAAIAGLAGYSEAKKGLAMLSDTLDKLPTVGKLPKEAIAGLIFNYFASRNPWIDAAAQAYLDIAGYKLGMAGFAISGDEDF
jgi:hypothetical protein